MPRPNARRTHFFKKDRCETEIFARPTIPTRGDFRPTAKCGFILVRVVKGRAPKRSTANPQRRGDERAFARGAESCRQERTEPTRKQEPPNKFLIIPPSQRSKSATVTRMSTETKSNCGNWDLTNERREKFSILPSTVLHRATMPSARFANARRDAMNSIQNFSQRTAHV